MPTALPAPQRMQTQRSQIVKVLNCRGVFDCHYPPEITVAHDGTPGAEGLRSMLGATLQVMGTEGEAQVLSLLQTTSRLTNRRDCTAGALSS